MLSSFEKLVNLDKSREEPMDETKPYKVSKEIVHEAFQRVKENQIAGDHPNLKDGVWFGRPPRTLGT